MFEATKVGRKVDKASFKEQQETLRTQLMEVQRELLQTDIPVIILITGVEGAGKGEVVNRLNEWLDTRGVQTFAFWDETDEERQRPRYWRFWRTLPSRGNLSILFGGWYQAPIERGFDGLCSEAELDAELTRIADFERMLINDGALVVKFWFHLSEKDQKNRLKELSRDDRSRWKMLPKKGKFQEHYDRYERLAERVIRHTDRGISPWFLIEADDRRYRDLTAGKTLLHAIKVRLSEPPAMEPPPTSSHLELPDLESARITLLDQLDLTKSLEREKYKSQLKELQAELNELAWEAYKKKRSVVLVFEGWTPAAREVPSAVSPVPSTPACTAPSPSPHRRTRRRPITTCGDSGATSPVPGTSPSTTAPGTDACWLSAWRASPRMRSGAAPTPRSTSSRSSSPRAALSCSSSGSR